MTRTEIENLNNEVVTDEEFEEIELNEEVIEVENCGTSGQMPDKILYCVHFENGNSIDILA